MRYRKKALPCAHAEAISVHQHGASLVPKVILCASLCVALGALTQTAFAKKVICVDDQVLGKDEISYNWSHEGWSRSQMAEGDEIRVGGNLKDCLDLVEDGDELIIITHGRQTKNGEGDVTDTGFTWGGTEYTGFGDGEDEFEVPDDWANLDNVKIKFCSCWSTLTPDGGTSVADDLLEELGGDGNSAEGFQGEACSNAQIQWSADHDTPRELIDKVLKDLEDNDDWADNPPANRPGADPNQQTAAQAQADKIAKGKVTIKIVYTEPQDGGSGTWGDNSGGDITIGCGCDDGCGIATFFFVEDSEMWLIDNENDLVGVVPTTSPDDFQPVGVAGHPFGGNVTALEFTDPESLFSYVMGSRAPGLYGIDLFTGQAFPIGSGGLDPGHNLTDMGYDGRDHLLYGIATDGNNGFLYEINPQSGFAQLIAPINGLPPQPGDLGLCVAANGDVLVSATQTDEVFILDLNTMTAVPQVLLPYDADLSTLASGNDGKSYPVSHIGQAPHMEVWRIDHRIDQVVPVGALPNPVSAGADILPLPNNCLYLQVENLVAGQTARWTVMGAGAGKKTAIVYGFNPNGTTTISGTAGYCATFDFKDVSANKLIGQPTADAFGVSTITKNIPGNLSGLSLLFQAAERGTCPEECVSNLVSTTIQ